MTISQALKVSSSPGISLSATLSTTTKSLGSSGALAKSTASNELQISTKALAFYQERIATSATPTYSAAKALALAASASPGSIVIADTAANISKSFDKLVAISGKISAIQQTDAAAIAISEAQFSAGLPAAMNDGLLNKINRGEFKVAISGVHTANLSAIVSYGSKIAAITIGDSSSNITAKLPEIATLGSKVSAISQTTKSALVLSYANTLQFANVLSKIDKGIYTLNLTDSASNIKTNIAAITQLGAKVSSISQTDTSEVIPLSIASLTTNLATLKKINNGSFKVSIEDTSAAVAKSWSTLSSAEKNITQLNLTDTKPAFTLSVAQAMGGADLIKKISNANLNLTVADSATGLSPNLAKLMALSDKITKITQTAVGNLSVTQSQLASDSLMAFLGKFSPPNYSLAVSGADKSNIASILGNSHVNAVTLTVSDGTLTSTDAATAAALQSAKITGITVNNATIANLGQLSADKRVKSIAIKDSAANLGNSSNLAIVDDLMKKNKGIISGINLDTDTHELLTVAQATYAKYAATVYAAPKNYALQVDLGLPNAGVALTPSQLRAALKTTANSNGSFGVQVWDFTKGVYTKAITLNPGVNFVKLGDTSTYLDSGNAKLNAVLNVGSYKWQQNPGQATANTSNYALQPNVFSLSSGSSNPTIRYKFLTNNDKTSNTLSTADKYGFAAMNAAQQASVTQALNYISSLVNINFQLVTSGSSDINFGTNDQGSTSGGYATGANAALGAVNLLLNNKSSVNTSPQPGDYGWETIVHEIGHTLGLKHPGAYNAGGGVAPGPYLTLADDNRRNTVMSYNNPVDAAINWVSNGNGGYTSAGVNPSTFMPLDILALQFLYGKNQTGVSLSDSSKTLANYQTTQFTSDWLGMETLSSTSQGLSLDLSSISASSIVDLRAGAFSSINIKDVNYNVGIGGAKKQSFYNLNNVGLAYDASISHLTGGASSDVVYVSNKDIEIDGNDGNDKVYLYGKASDWIQTNSADETVYTNGSVTAKLKNIELIGYYSLESSPTTHSRIDLSA